MCLHVRSDLILFTELALNGGLLKAYSLNLWISFSKLMKRLILMRHAKTEPWFQGGDDRGRALVPRGKSDAARMARELAYREWQPDLVLVSSARRTVETWAAMATDLAPCQRLVLDSLYLAGTSALEREIVCASHVSTLLVLGHNPGIHDLAAHVSSRAGATSQQAAMTLAAKMPTAAAALFEADEDGAFDPAGFRLQEYIIAKTLRAEEAEK